MSLKVMAAALLALALTACGVANRAANAVSNRSQYYYYNHLVCAPNTSAMPSWMPGDRIIYIQGSGVPGHFDLRMMNSQGGDDHLLLSDAGSPIASLDGTQILVQDIANPNAPAPSSSLLDLKTMQTRTLGNMGDAPSWSPDGKTLLYTLPDPTVPIMRLDVATGQSTAVLPAQPGLAAGDSAPRWSPDGKTISFTSDRGGQGLAIYLVGADGQGLRQLPGQDMGVCPGGGQVTNIVLAWSPDSARLAYAHACGSTMDLSVIALDAQRPDWTYTASYISRAAWSPDGRQFLAEVANGQGFSLLVGGADGATFRPVAAGADYPSWSPDGTHIVYTSSTGSSPTSDLFTMAADGTDVRQLTHNAPQGSVCPH